jgi:hypothetical protein
MGILGAIVFFLKAIGLSAFSADAPYDFLTNVDPYESNLRFSSENNRTSFHLVLDGSNKYRFVSYFSDQFYKKYTFTTLQKIEEIHIHCPGDYFFIFVPTEEERHNRRGIILEAGCDQDKKTFFKRVKELEKILPGNSINTQIATLEGTIILSGVKNHTHSPNKFIYNSITACDLLPENFSFSHNVTTLLEESTLKCSFAFNEFIKDISREQYDACISTYTAAFLGILKTHFSSCNLKIEKNYQHWSSFLRRILNWTQAIIGFAERGYLGTDLLDDGGIRFGEKHLKTSYDLESFSDQKQLLSEILQCGTVGCLHDVLLPLLKNIDSGNDQDSISISSRDEKLMLQIFRDRSKLSFDVYPNN